MAIKVKASLNRKELAAISPKRIKKGISSAMRKASTTSLRDMRSEAAKRVRARKRIKARDVKQALVKRKNRGRTIDSMSWGLDVRGDTVRLSAYPHRKTKKGVSVSINRGRVTRVVGGFIATTGSGHKGVFVRKGPRRLPIVEPLGSRPVDALLHRGEAAAISRRGRVTFIKTTKRLLAAELSKGA